MPVQTRIQYRRDTAANWTSTNPTLGNGEVGYETDTGLTKIGNGTSTWTALSYGAVEQIKHPVKAAVAVNKGQPVYVSSANGTNMLVSLSSNNAEATSSKTLGLAASTMAINGQGSVISEGLLSGIDTSTATAGDPVWLGVNGALLFGLANKPVAPAHMVSLGVVTRVHATNGEIFVRVQNGFELEELHNVSILAPSNGHLLKYNGATQLWENASQASLSIAKTQVAGTAITAADTGTVTNTMLANSSITVNGSSVSLGGSVTVVGESFHPFLLIGA